MRQKLRIGILGAGKMGRVYSDWFSRNPYCDVAAIYNRSEIPGRNLADKYNAIYYDNWEELVRSPEIDVVGVCTPSCMHGSQVEAAARAGKSILCEKPMADNYLECQRMTQTCEEHGVTFMVGFQMRFHPVVVKVNELIPQLGDIYHIDFNFGMYRPDVDWRHSLNQGGGALKELGCHLFDLSRMWVGELRHVCCENNSVEPNRDVEDDSIVLLRFQNNAIGYIYCGYEDRRAPKVCGTIMGRKGQVNFSFSSYKTEDSHVRWFDESGRNKENFPILIPDYIDQVYPGHMDSFGKEIDHFVECIFLKKKPMTGGYDGFKSMEAVYAAYESQRTGKKASIPISYFELASLKECFPQFCEANSLMEGFRE